MEVDSTKNDLTLTSSVVEDPNLQFDVIKEVFTPETWAKFTGLKVKNYSEEELEAFKKPFQMGWRRELVLRANNSFSGKKIGDVYYFSPCKKVKLRSYVEMGLYLKKHQDCELEPENFTFARQPIYKSPEELIRNALPKGSNGSQIAKLKQKDLSEKIPPLPQLTPITEFDSNKLDKEKLLDEFNDSSSKQDDKNNLNNSVAEGRAKRKRVAPTRFEDEDYSEQSLSKKKVVKVTPPTNLNLQNQTPSKIKEKLILPNLIKNNETILSSNNLTSTPLISNNPIVSNINSSDKDSVTSNKTDKSEKLSQNDLSSFPQDPLPDSESVTSNSSSNKKFTSFSIENSPSSDQKVPSIKIKVNKRFNNDIDSNKISINGSDNEFSDEAKNDQQPIPPCSIMCGGRRGNLPSLLCSRCLCLFHPQCVLNGIFLKDSKLFVCSNCLNPTDLSNAIEDSKKLFNQNNSTLESYEVEKNKLNKLPQNLKNQHNLKNDNMPKTNFNHKNNIKKSSINNNFTNHALAKKLPHQNGVNIRLPAGTNLYRVNTSNGNGYFQNNHLASNNKLSKSNYNSSNNLHLKQKFYQESMKKNDYLIKGNGANASYASRRYHLDNMNRSLLSSQQLLQSIKTSMSSLDFNSNEFASMLRTKKLQKRNFDYFNKFNSGLNIMVKNYEALTKIFSYLCVKDLLQCKLVNKTFYNLVSQTSLWKKINLKNLVIHDWNYFINKIILPNNVNELCFEGLRCPSNESLDNVWNNLKLVSEHLNSVKRVRFGKISIKSLEKLLESSQNEENKIKYNPFLFLEELSIKNLYNDQPDTKFFNLDIIDSIGHIKNLKLLRLESKQGFDNDESCVNQLNKIADLLPELKCFYLPSLKGYSVEKFEFLTKLTKLEKLEIGSCESWTTCDLNDEFQNLDTIDEEGEEVDGGFDNIENQENENLFENNKISNKHRGAFKYLSMLRNLKELSLTDVIIDETSNQFPLVLEKMRDLESLSLGYVTVSPDATQTLNMLCNTFKSKLPKLKKFSISTEDSHTNKCVFDLLLKRLENLEELQWKVGSQVEDSGTCLVPFIKERGIESDLENEDNLDLTLNSDYIEMIETCHLNEILHKYLSKTRIIILPQ